MTGPARNAQLPLRITSTQKAVIEDAAGAAGTSVNAFAVETLLREARGVVREGESWAAFEEALARLARSITKLADLLRRPAIFDPYAMSRAHTLLTTESNRGHHCLTQVSQNHGK